ncbi:MAG: nucleotidyltransferase family protein [Candidatus Micrarchaeaceae archaeon]
MKAIILAAGFGKRLRPLTDKVPKPMIEIAGKPILEWQIQWLSKYVDGIIIHTSYKKEIIFDWVAKNENKFGISIAITTEDSPSGTAGAVFRSRNLVSDFFVVNGDILTNIDLSKLKPMSIALVRNRSPYGIVDVENDLVTSFVEKPVLDYWINAGIYRFTSEIFDYVKESGDLERDVFPVLAKKGLLRAVKFDDVYWTSIDNVKDIEEAEQEIKNVMTDN